MSNYLYNGVELPVLPEWDSASYPYATILVYDNKASDAQYYDIYFTNVPIFYNPSKYRYLTKLDCTAIVYSILVLDGKYLDVVDYSEVDSWGNKTSKNFVANTETAISFVGSPYKPFWANYDIINYSDNSVVIDGSDYGEDPEDPEQPTLTARDLYKIINGKTTKLTLYKKINGKLKQIQLNEGEI